jgi:hypothetical protein
MESWKEIAFWTIYLLMMTVVPLTKRTKLLKQVQNFYFLRESGILWWWKRSLVVEGTQETQLTTFVYEWDAIKTILRQKKHWRIGEN